MNSIDDISLAQWSLIEEWREGKWKTLDFPRLAREDFNLDGVEFVNTLFEVPTEGYLRQLKQNAATHGITMVLIMIDDEGDGCSPDKQERKEFGIFHRKWVDIAQYLGCHAIRTNCRGPQAANKPSVDKQEALNWAAESYHPLLEYARPAGVKILIENHGGISNDPDWMVQLMKKINDPLFGTYPDWREPASDFNNVEYLEKTVSFAKGMSFRDQPDDNLTIQMLEICRKNNFHGWYGIESDGREAIKKSIGILTKYLTR
jgi:hypothetical protein